MRTVEEILRVGAFSHTVYFSLKSVGDFRRVIICGPTQTSWEKLEPSYTACGTTKWFSHFIKQSESSQKVKLYDYHMAQQSPVLLLGIFLKIYLHTKTYRQMLKTALFKIMQAW